jgi:hypothetical protein
MMAKAKFKKARKGCLYTTDERDIIKAFKREYRSQDKPNQRGHILKAKILPAIFNYWTDDGRVPMGAEELEERVNVSSSWIISK